jgi:glutamate dehydrogenase/leucine dehydrogenase
MLKRVNAVIVLVAFLLSTVLGPDAVLAQNLILPEPGAMVEPSAAFVPVSLQGVAVYADNPLLFDFIVDTGHTGLLPGSADDKEIAGESERLVRYFLASLTTPEKNQWVNLSPYEKDRMLSEEMGRTELGRDLLAQDYVLKQLTASMITPEKSLGKAFWDRVYERAQNEFGTTEIPVDTLNKVWIVTDRAAVYAHRNPQDGNRMTALITDMHLKVMLETDYLAAQYASGAAGVLTLQESSSPDISQQVLRDIIIPEIEKDVNEGRNFAGLRQIHQAVILATWYKRNLRQSLLTRAYADRARTGGLEGAWVKDSGVDLAPEAIWNKYVDAYRQGVFNFIKDDINPMGEVIPRKYFSGGDNPVPETVDNAARTDVKDAVGKTLVVTVSGRMEDEAATLTSAGKAVKRLENPYWTKMRNRVRGISDRFKEELNPQLVLSLLKPRTVTKSWATIPQISPSGEKQEADIYFERVRNNTILGPAKGGIRWVLASDLMNDTDFVDQWEKFVALEPSEEEVRSFVGKWIEGDVLALSLGMTLKVSGSRLALGGGKGGIFIGKITRKLNSSGRRVWTLEDYEAGADGKVDWKKFPLANKARIARAHAWALARSGTIGPDKDIPAPDMRTDSQILGWYEDEYLRYLTRETNIIREYNVDLYQALGSIEEDSDPTRTAYLDVAYRFWRDNSIPVPWLGVFTGKDPDVYGVAGRAEATGFGVVDVIKFFIGDLQGKTAAVNGFGNVGYFTALRLVKEGASLKVINDLGITLVKEGDGVWTENELQDILVAIREAGTLRDAWTQGRIFLQGVTAALDSPQAVADAVFGARVDILVPAAIQEAITAREAELVVAPWVFEGANGPITEEAERILEQKGINVIPDTLANAGGVTVSSYETDQTNGDHLLTVEETTAMRQASLQRAAEAVAAEKKVHPQLSWREAFDLSAIKNIFRVMYSQMIRLHGGDLPSIARAVSGMIGAPVSIDAVIKDIRSLGLEQSLQDADSGADSSERAPNQDVGGIDLDASGALTASGDAAMFAFDEQVLERLQSGNFSGISPVILRITPLIGTN